MPRFSRPPLDSEISSEDWVCCHTRLNLLNKRIQSRICKGKRLGEKPKGEKHKLLEPSLSGVTYHLLDSLTTGNALYQGSSLVSGPRVSTGADPAGTLCLTHTLKRVPDSSSWIPVGWPTIPVSSDTIYLEIESYSTGKGHHFPNSLHLRCQSQVQVVTCASGGLWMGGSRDYFCGFFLLICCSSW